jgi:hypothetical protein
VKTEAEHIDTPSLTGYITHGKTRRAVGSEGKRREI